MKKAWYGFVLLYALIVLLPYTVTGQHLVPSEKDSKVEFRVNYHKNGNESVKGRFSNIKGDITFDPKQPGKSSFDISINAASINTGIPERDKALKNEQFFNHSLYPVIHLKSTSVAADGPGGIIYVLHGDLTIKGITKPVNVQFTATPMGTGYLFRGSFHLDRMDYKLGEKGDIDNDVSLFIEVKTIKK